MDALFHIQHPFRQWTLLKAASYIAVLHPDPDRSIATAMTHRFAVKALGLSAALAVVCSALPAPALAQSQAQMTVAQFLEDGRDIPRNRAAAMLRSDTRRLVRVATGAVNQIKAEQASAERAGRRPNHCIPSTGTGITPESLVARFEAMPAGRRNVTVTQAVRDWMVERYPCRG